MLFQKKIQLIVLLIFKYAGGGRFFYNFLEIFEKKLNIFLLIKKNFWNSLSSNRQNNWCTGGDQRNDT